MTKMQLGGIKILEGQACLEWSGGEVEYGLADLCCRFASERINLSQLTYMADDGKGRSSTALCTESGRSHTSYFLVKLDSEREPRLERDASILSIFPHDRRPIITGALLELAAHWNIHPLGLASSPSAMSLAVPSDDAKQTIDEVFNIFEFPTYRSPLEWQAAYADKEQVFKDVIGSYEEQVPKVYAVLDMRDLDLWTVTLARTEMPRMGGALRSLDALKIKMPFFVAHCNRPGEFAMGLCFPNSSRHDVGEALKGLTPDAACSVRDAAGISLHGPHFGDRYGIACALTDGLHSAGVNPLALSCAVHSIWVVLDAPDLQKGMQAIRAKFHIPTSK